MSAYIVDDKTINKIVSYLYAKAAGRDTSIVSTGLVRLGFDLSNADLAELLANQMFDMNVAAIKARYGEAEGEGFPLPSFTYLFTPATQIEVIKALECWKYQCTVRDIPLSEFYKAMAQIHHLLCADYIHRLEEYEAATWG
jgi:hypothetical protein